MTADLHRTESIVRDLRNIGIESGDVLLVRADCMRIGMVEGGVSGILDALLEAIGPDGTLVVPAFTKQFLIWRMDTSYVRDQTTPSTSGALTRLVLKHPGCVRSEHPTTSFAAIGNKAEAILAGHDGGAPAYLPMRRIIELDGKMLVSGCAASNPGFTTVHYAQEVLGLSRRSVLRNRIAVRYRTEGGAIELFRRSSIGGCNKGFHHFYSNYVMSEKLFAGMVGSAYSIQINAREAYQIEMALLRKDPRQALCDDPLCFSCRATWLYNKRDWIPYVAGLVLARLGHRSSYR